LHNRFVVGGYVRKRVTLRISKGLRAVALAARISQRVYSDTRVIFITIIAINITLAEKIGTPLIKTSLLDSPVGPITTIYFQLCCAEAYTTHSYPFAQGGRKRRTSTHQVTQSRRRTMA
jgi:hypothetical protein